MKQKKFSQDYSKTKNIEKFLHKIIRKTRFLIATLFSLPLQKLFLKLFKAIDVILERYFNLPALFIFFILI